MSTTDRILVKLVNINNRRLQFAKDLHIAAVDQLGAKRGQSDGLGWGMENRTSCTSGKNGTASDALMDREHQVSGETMELACVLESAFQKTMEILHPLPSPNQAETETGLRDSPPVSTACKRDKAGEKRFSPISKLQRIRNKAFEIYCLSILFGAGSPLTRIIFTFTTAGLRDSIFYRSGQAGAECLRRLLHRPLARRTARRDLFSSLTHTRCARSRAPDAAERRSALRGPPPSPPNRASDRQTSIAAR